MSKWTPEQTRHIEAGLPVHTLVQCRRTAIKPGGFFFKSAWSERNPCGNVLPQQSVEVVLIGHEGMTEPIFNIVYSRNIRQRNEGLILNMTSAKIVHSPFCCVCEALQAFWPASWHQKRLVVVEKPVDMGSMLETIKSNDGGRP